MSTKKIGGIRFISIGRIRISFCVARRIERLSLSGNGELCCTLACGAFALYGLAQTALRLVNL